ncbi:MAG: hypothetical protein Q9192_001996 [Flavoplaca navasiana]
MAEPTGIPPTAPGTLQLDIASVVRTAKDIVFLYRVLRETVQRAIVVARSRKLDHWLLPMDRRLET